MILISMFSRPESRREAGPHTLDGSRKTTRCSDARSKGVQGIGLATIISPRFVAVISVPVIANFIEALQIDKIHQLGSPNSFSVGPNATRSPTVHRGPLRFSARQGVRRWPPQPL
jgi:hypothetical protein